jgi:hypothetical protein
LLEWGGVPHATLLDRTGLRMVSSLHQSVPMNALDLPVSKLARPFFMAAVKAVFAIGDLFGLSYVQTVMVERSR